MDLDANQRKDEDSDGNDSDASMSSADLSEESDSDDSEFDAKEKIKERGDLLLQNNRSTPEFIVNSDDALKKLMDMRVEDFIASRPQTLRRGGMQVVVPKIKQNKKKRQSRKHVVTDSSIKTDVFPVRQALRQAFRNMPFNDFVKLINFLLRAMQLIKFSANEPFTFWHGDDPTFRHTMGVKGSNQYTTTLLTTMGFAKLTTNYWVWPYVHLKPSKIGKKWCSCLGRSGRTCKLPWHRQTQA